jgi:hypothetical protein
MTRRKKVWLAGAVLGTVALAVLTPGSPIQLAAFVDVRGRYYDNHPPAYWIKALHSPDPRARHQALFALGSIGAEAEETVPEVAERLREDADEKVRGAAALALLKMAPASRSAVPALAQALEDAHLLVRMNAAMALLRLGVEARSAVPALIAALEDQDNQTNLGKFFSTIQEVVILALGKASAGDAEAVPALQAVLEDAASEETRSAVVRALGEIGPAARPALPRLQALLTEQNANVRQAAEEALRKIGGESAAAEGRSRAVASRKELELPEVQRRYLWEIEHHGNLLVKHGFGPLAAALKESDAAALSRLLADDFHGFDLDRPRRVRAGCDYAEVERLQDAGHSPRSVDREEFVARLLAYRRLFGDKAPQVKLALMALHPRGRGVLEGDWEGTAQLRLHGEHAHGAPAEAVILLRYQVARPTEEGLARPGWLHSAQIVQALTAKAPSYLFADVTQQRGLDTSRLHDNWKTADFDPTPGGVYVTDFDRDGILDVLVTDPSGPALYRGRSDGTFENVTAGHGLPSASLASTVAAWLDIDGDGWEDLILGDRIYRNEAGARFVDYTDRCNLHLPIDAANIVIADYDRDGKLDLYVTRPGRPGVRSWLDGKSESPGNRLFHNEGNWRFRDATKASGAGGDHPSTFTAAWLDADNDGWPDLHVLNEFGDGLLLINNRDGTFSGRTLANRPADFGSMGLAVGDINNDGHIDLFCANMYSKAGTRVIGNLAEDAYPPAVLEKMRRFVAGSQLHLNRGGLKFEQVGPRMQVAAVGWSYGACLADLDNDGWLDIYATAGYVSRNRDEPDG